MGGYAYAHDSSKAAEIRHLIGSVEALNGATFLRNKSEYDTRKAADRPGLKLKLIPLRLDGFRANSV
jgi:hypothetical protein